jgi:hypothetical protein
VSTSDKPARRGRSSTYTSELAHRICERLADGETLRAICRDEGRPDERTVREWAVDDVEGFSPQYARARQTRPNSFARQDKLDAQMTDLQARMQAIDRARTSPMWSTRHRGAAARRAGQPRAHQPDPGRAGGLPAPSRPGLCLGLRSPGRAGTEDAGDAVLVAARIERAKDAGVREGGSVEPLARSGRPPPGANRKGRRASPRSPTGPAAAEGYSPQAP